jgi:hypothetical protein
MMMRYVGRVPLLGKVRGAAAAGGLNEIGRRKKVVYQTVRKRM